MGYPVYFNLYFEELSIGCKRIPMRYLRKLEVGNPNNEIKKYMKEISLYVYRNKQNKLIVRRWGKEEVISKAKIKTLIDKIYEHI